MQAAIARPRGLVDQFGDLGQLFLEERIEEIADHFVVPCPVTLGDTLRPLRDRADLVDYLTTMCEFLRSSGVVDLVPQVVGVELPRDGRSRVWVNWLAYRADGSSSARGAIYHLLRRDRSALCIEAIEAAPWPPPEWETAPAATGGIYPVSASSQERARIRVALLDLLGRLGRTLTDGRLDELADLHVFPCPYEAFGRFEIIRDPATLKLVVGRWRAAQATRGVLRYTAHLVPQEVPRGARLRTWVRWEYGMADGSVQDGGTDLLYLLRQPDDRLVIEMIDFLSLPADGNGPSPQTA